MAIIGGGERDLTIKLFANVDNFQKNMKSATKDTEDFTGKTIDFLGKVGIAVAAAGAAVGAFAIKLGKDSVVAAIEAQKQQERLATLLRTTGGATEEQIKVLALQADALSKVGVATKDNITITQSQLATFDLTAGTIAKLTPAIIDYVVAEKGATASTDDFKQMTNGLAQALNGNFASLTRTGFVLDETTKNMIKNGTETERAAALVEVLNSTYKDFNAIAGETAEGQLIRLQNEFDSLRVKIGEALLPILLELVGLFRQEILPRIVDFVDFLVEKMIPAIEQYVRPALKRLADSFAGVKKATQDAHNEVAEFRGGLYIFGNMAKEIFLAVLQGPVIVLDLLAKAFEWLIRLVGFAVLAFRRDYDGAMRMLKQGTDEATLATARMHLEFQKLQSQVDTTSNSMANAYRQFNYYNGVLNTGTKPAVDATEKAIKDLQNTIVNTTLATDKASEAKKAFGNAQKETKKSVDSTNLSLKEQLAILRDFGGASFAAAGGGAAKTGALMQESARSAAEIVSQFGGFVEGFNLRPTDPYYGFGQGSDIRTFPRNAGVVNINVQGTVIDPEGAARAISQLLVNGSGRAGDLPIYTPLGNP